VLVLAASVWEYTHCIYTHDSHVPTTSGKLSLYVYIQLSIRCPLFAYVGTYNNTRYKYCAFSSKYRYHVHLMLRMCVALHRVLEAWSINGSTVAMADLGLSIILYIARFFSPIGNEGEVCETYFCGFRFQPTSDTASR
jgi:hypothetical protein